MKLIPSESSINAELNKHIFNYLLKTFINTNFAFKNSFRIRYVVKKMLLDWDRYAIAGSPGHFLKEGKTARVTIEALCPTYLSQSTKHFCNHRIRGPIYEAF